MNLGSNKLLLWLNAYYDSPCWISALSKLQSIDCQFAWTFSTALQSNFRQHSFGAIKPAEYTHMHVHVCDAAVHRQILTQMLHKYFGSHIPDIYARLDWLKSFITTGISETLHSFSHPVVSQTCMSRLELKCQMCRLKFTVCEVNIVREIKL